MAIQSNVLPMDFRSADSTGNDFKRAVLDHIVYTCAKHPKDALPADVYRAMAHSVRDRLVRRWLATQQAYAQNNVKVAYYLSSEFLTGKSLGLCLLNLGLTRVAQEIAHGFGFDLEAALESEGDPGLGNGGLGRLAACFMDSLATLQLPAIGYGIRYEYGIFEQRIENGQQIERRDSWLQHGNPWELPRIEHTQRVQFGGRTEHYTGDDGRFRARWVGTRQVLGVPYDSFIVGHRTDTVNTLRLWSARATHDFDLRLFNEGDYLRAVEEKVDCENISKVLYPSDQTEEGKALRLRQQYFFVACSIADILRRYKRRHEDFSVFADRAAIQMNDTHPAIAVAELMRVLVDQENLDWDVAWELTVAACGYTNHTLLPEALERWPVPLFERLLPRHLEVIYEINSRFLRQVHTRWPGNEARVRQMSIIEESDPKKICMAHLATVGSHSINGVAQLHTKLVKEQLLEGFCQLWPERFNNKTNGVTPRRWLLFANPRLTGLISERIGTGWIDHDLTELDRLRAFADDAETLSELTAVKAHAKAALSRSVQARTGVELPPTSMFVIQVKRIHEYKRQLLACLQIIDLYLQAKDNPTVLSTPRAFVFAGKAAAGYATAKQHIRLINDVATVINADPHLGGRLRVVFVPNYGVSLAQSIIPAADLSVQISLAGKEASGTSNMKLALNGALTIGTLDGANVEIRDKVGPDNFFLFGLTSEQVVELRAGGYSPAEFIERDPRLARVLEFLNRGFFSLDEPGRYKSVVDYLRYSDPFMVCADFRSYVETEQIAAELFADEQQWARRSLLNIAGAGCFSSDDTVRRYAQDIWGIHPAGISL